MSNSRSEQYCPICGKVLVAVNKKEVESGQHSGYIFVHKPIDHTEEDIQALQYRIQ